MRERIKVPWGKVVHDIGAKYNLVLVAKDLGVNIKTLEHIEKEYVIDPAITLGVGLLDIHCDAVGDDLHKQIARDFYGKIRYRQS